jgi:hypothetical protein
MVTERLRQGWNRRLEAFRLRVSRADAIPELCLLGVLSGALAAAVIIAFRSLIEFAQDAFLPHYYDYESLDPLASRTSSSGSTTTRDVFPGAMPPCNLSAAPWL